MGNTYNNLPIPHDLFEGYGGILVAHNMKFDWEVMEKYGVKMPRSRLYCTMMLSCYIDENHKPVGHSFDEIVYKYIGVRKKIDLAKAIKTFGWESIPPYIMADYAEQDCRPLPDLFRKLGEEVSPVHWNLWEEVDSKFMLLLAEIEMRGIPIDRDLCAEYEAQCAFRLDEIQKELGFDPAKTSQLHPKLFSEPPVGLGLIVPSRTPKSGQPQVSLEWLASQGHPVCSLIHEYRKTAKQKSSYFTAYLKATTRDNPRLHPNFKQHGAETGRMSCANPNLQQIPREEWKDAYVKKLFLPEDGWELWEIDYRTIEYRLSAVYAESDKLISLFENEGDFHQLVADDVTTQMGKTLTRQQAKTVNYLMSFGGGPDILATKLGVDVSLAKKIHKGYKASYPEIFEKALEAQNHAESNNFSIDMWHGRTRHFQWRSECHKAFNAIIQGGAFEIMKRSMLLLQERGFIVCNQVHDSVWINAKNEAEVIEAQKIMEGWTHGVFGLSFRTDRKLLRTAN